jgi:hypothetical protein
VFFDCGEATLNNAVGRLVDSSDAKLAAIHLIGSLELQFTASTIGTKFYLSFSRPHVAERLWALNKAHLEFIEIYAGALIRERSGAANARLASPIASVDQIRKDREVVLKAVAKLKQLS